jgi:outer membrane autotransporter protein
LATEHQSICNDSLACDRTRLCNDCGARRGASHWRRRHTGRIEAFAMIASAVALAAAAPAQAQFTSITDFGDSYADTGSAPGGAFHLIGIPCPTGYTSCRFTGSTNFVDTLQAIYHTPTATNYAIGGARTDDSNTLSSDGLNDGFTYELQQLAKFGTHFTNSDLILLSIGGNDLSASFSSESVPAIENDAIASAQREITGVQQMVAVGARNIVIFGTGSSAYFPVPTVGPDSKPFQPDQRNGWADTYYLKTEEGLAPLAHAGVRIFLFDFAVLQARLAADPSLYGFATNCTAVPLDPPQPSPPPVVANCFYENSVHPTGAGMALVANYMANQIDAPTTVVSQGAIATALATNFTGSVFGRLDAYRTLDEFGMGGATSTSSTMPAKGLATAAPENRWSVYGGANYSGGSGAQQFLAPGYNYNAVGGDLGLEYRLDPKLRLGAVFGYSAPDVSLNIQNAHDHIDSYQFAAYASFADKNWFANALVAYGRDEYALDRQGVIDVIHGATGADVFTAAAQAGYLVDVGSIRAGPIAGLDYTHALIHGYTETGDSLLTMMVGQQSVDDLIGDVGFELRSPFAWGGNLFSPFVNVTVEKNFLGGGRVVTTTQVTAPLLPVLTPVPSSNWVYGQVAAGVAASLGGNVSASLNVATTVARQGGNDFSASLGIKVGF